jgi:hypothetical protein
MTQVVEHLPSKHKALSSNPKTTKKKNQQLLTPVCVPTIAIQWSLGPPNLGLELPKLCANKFLFISQLPQILYWSNTKLTYTVTMTTGTAK